MSLFAADKKSSPARPNILWLIAEDFGPHLGCYGTKEVWTPNLDQLARAGVRYTRFFTTAPVCSTSRSAFMTGMYQTTISAHNHRSHRDDGYTLPPGVRLLTDWFRDAGYFTANVRELPAVLGFRAAGKTDWNFTYTGRSFDSDRWSDLKANQPFFAQINFQETHRAFYAPKRADPAKAELPPWTPDHPVAREDWAKYLDSATELDRKVGLVLRQLEADGLADNTVVVFFGDNGMAHFRGKQFCYDSGLHVPLIIRWRRGFSPPKHFKPGSVDERLLMAIDLAPTMLELAGAKKPAKMQGESFLGPRAGKPREYVFGARDRCDETVFRFRTVRDARYRYIRNFTPDRPFLQSNEYKEKQYPVWNLLKQLDAEGKLTPVQALYCAPTMPVEELYDLQTDPHEISNLTSSPKYQKVLNRLRGVLEKWIEETNDQGRELEPSDLAARKGVTNTNTQPNTGYTLDGAPPSGASAAKAQKQAARPATPEIDGDWWQVAGQPDLGALTGEKQEPVDFAIWQAADGTWQLWSCIRKTKEPGNTRLLYRWEGARLTNPNWKPMGIAMRADPKFGETPGGLQAPFVFRERDIFHLFYGDWERICRATGSDGKTFARVLDAEGKTGLFGEGQGANTRDPMGLSVRGVWHCYYTAFPNRQGAVFARTSADLTNWSGPRIVNSGGKGGSGPFSAECPHVVERDGYFYLFRTERYGKNNLTHVYRSTDPLNFGRDEDVQYWIASLPVAAPEIVRHEGQDYVAALNLALDGIRVAKLKWNPSEAPRR
jgi:arylsulfatase A-like enzyme